MKFSIPVSTYNRAEHLRQVMIPSLLAQTYQEWECHIVGDGCTDETEEVVAGFGDPRITFENLPEPWYRKESVDIGTKGWNIAGKPALNRGLEKCQGELIARIDDDDKWRSNHLEILLEGFNTGFPCEVVHTNTICYMMGSYAGRIAGQIHMNNMLHSHNHVCHSSVAWRNSGVLKGVRYNGDGSIPGDWQMWKDFVMLGARWKHMDYDTVVYLQRCSIEFSREAS